MTKPAHGPDWEQLDRNFHKWLIKATLEDRVKLYKFLMCKSVDLERYIKGFDFKELFIGVDFGMEGGDRAIMVTMTRKANGDLQVLDRVDITNLAQG